MYLQLQHFQIFITRGVIDVKFETEYLYYMHAGSFFEKFENYRHLHILFQFQFQFQIFDFSLGFLIV